MWKILFIILLLKTSIAIYANADDDDDDWSKHFLPENYSALSPLINISVILNINVKGVLNLEPKSMEFTLDLHFKILWVDNQLPPMSMNYKILPDNIMKKIYYPYMELANCKGCTGFSVISDPERHKFTVYKMWIVHRYREKYKFYCLFDMSRYPFDVQTCSMDIRLNIYSGNVTIPLDREKEKYRLIDTNKIPTPSEFKLTQIKVIEIECPQENGTELDSFCFSYVFTFQRTILQHMLVIFAPSIFIVMLSWISFWLDVELAAPRVALGQTSLLTLAAQFNAAQRNLPSVTAVKALDVWMFVCILMAFASLLEFALAFNFNKKDPDKVTSLVKARNAESNIKTFMLKRNICNNNSNWFRKRTIDSWSKQIFPFTFLVFNLIFWFHYLT